MIYFELNESEFRKQQSFNYFYLLLLFLIISQYIDNPICFHGLICNFTIHEDYILRLGKQFTFCKC